MNLFQHHGAQNKVYKDMHRALNSTPLYTDCTPDPPHSSSLSDLTTALVAE